MPTPMTASDPSREAAFETFKQLKRDSKARAAFTGEPFRDWFESVINREIGDEIAAC